MSRVDAIDAEADPRIQVKTATLNGVKYEYFYGVPRSGKWSQTVFLVCIL